MLNNSGECQHFCLVLDLKGKSFTPFSIEYNVNCGFLVYGLYYVEVSSLYTQFVEGFYYERILYFVKCFFCIY